ncbi:MAG: hypothetical protein M3312_10730 [Actinomycetota bacterium]|nr:hypothetical protein [Actinomycetota bacterium]
MDVVPLTRTLDQELLALGRGASLECLACGEFVMRTDDGLVCGECGSRLTRTVEIAEVQLELGSQAG